MSVNPVKISLIVEVIGLKLLKPQFTEMLEEETKWCCLLEQLSVTRWEAEAGKCAFEASLVYKVQNS